MTLESSIRRTLKFQEVVHDSFSRNKMEEIKKHSEFEVLSESPFNGSPPLSLLLKTPVTPNDLFFVRNHAPVPEIDTDEFRLTVKGNVTTALSLSLAQLREMFKEHTVEATLQCAGNRRRVLMEHKEIPGEVPWGDEAISNSHWTGVRLLDVLKKAGVGTKEQHVAFLGLDQIEKKGKTFGFGSSIPLNKAIRPEVLLAYEMNGDPLPPEHGFPLRVVVPGYIGARSVKWLSDISVQDNPSENYYQALAYKLFPPTIDQNSVDWNSGIMLGEQSLNSVICAPHAGDGITAGSCKVCGYAIAGGENTIASVEVSIDGGKSWLAAELKDVRPWAWCFWEAGVTFLPGPSEIIVRATDSSENSQPQDVETTWNFKGYMNNAWHRVMVHAL